jgi:hypothetical protein
VRKMGGSGPAQQCGWGTCGDMIASLVSGPKAMVRVRNWAVGPSASDREAPWAAGKRERDGRGRAAGKTTRQIDAGSRTLASARWAGRESGP